MGTRIISLAFRLHDVINQIPTRVTTLHLYLLFMGQKAEQVEFFKCIILGMCHHKRVPSPPFNNMFANFNDSTVMS